MFSELDKYWDIFLFHIRTYHNRIVLRVDQKTLDCDQVCQIYASCQGLYGDAMTSLAAMLGHA